MREPLAQVLGEVSAVVARIDTRMTPRFVDRILRARRTYITGVGRSGLIVKAFGQRLMHLGLEVHLADEITAPAIGRGDLLVACSGTGATTMTLYMARKARRIGARVASITASARSPLAKASDLVVAIPSPLERGKSRDGLVSRQPARSLFEQAMLLYLDSVVLALMSAMKVSAGRIERRHANLE